MASLVHSVIRRASGRNYLRKNVAVHQFVQKANYAEAAAQAETQILISDETAAQKLSPEKIEQLRNVSRLRSDHYRILHGEPQFPNAQELIGADEHQKTLRWMRRQFGLYGLASGVNPAICFTTKEEMEDIQAYEKVAHDKSIMEIRDAALQRLAEEKEQYRIREEQIDEKIKNIEEFKKKIREKMETKTVEVSAAKKERERLLEEVRRFFGYTIDPKDEKFQIMLEYKEKEQQKLKRDAKKKEKEEKFLAKLAALESGVDVKKTKKENEKETK